MYLFRALVSRVFSKVNHYCTNNTKTFIVHEVRVYSDESSAYKNSIAAGDFQWIFVCNGEGTEQLRNRYVKTLMKTVAYLRNLDVVLVAEEDVLSYMQKVGCIYSEPVMVEDR